MTELLRAALRLYSRERLPLLGIAAAVTIPVAALVLVLDLIAWRPVDPSRPDAVQRRLGDTTRVVDQGRFTAIAVVRYGLGAAAYVAVAALALRPLRASIGAAAGERPAPASPARAAGALAAGIALVAAVRGALSTAGAAALAATASTGALAYLAAINAVHAVGKVVTAPFLAALLAAADAARRRRPGD